MAPATTACRMSRRARPSLTFVLTAMVALTAFILPAQASAAAQLNLTPSSGPAGATVDATGGGFPKRAAGTITVDGVSSSFSTDRRGSFTKRVTIPASATASVSVTARAGGATASAAYKVVLAARQQFGVSTPGGPTATAELDEVAGLAGEQPSVVLWFADFRQQPPISGLDAVVARGATPLVTWEPWVWGGGTTQPAYALARIANGEHDAYIRSWADALRAWGRPVMLRFGHEMNGNWYPWSEAVNGNRPGDYVAAWRHVRSVFTAAGATNVKWVWSPNISYTGSLALAGLYPGHDAVDVVGVDGYNFGSTSQGTTWTSPAALFGPTLDELRALAPGKPLMIAETASTELGGSKAEWVGSFFTWLATQPDVKTFVWFHHQKETDWRINSSADSASAFRAGLASLPD